MSNNGYVLNAFSSLFFYSETFRPLVSIGFGNDTDRSGIETLRIAYTAILA